MAALLPEKEAARTAEGSKAESRSGTMWDSGRVREEVRKEREFGERASERAVERDTHGRSWPGGREHTRASIGKAKIQVKEEGIQV